MKVVGIGGCSINKCLPTNTDNETLDNPWERDIIILLKIPLMFRLNIAINEGFKCKIEEKL